MNALQRIFAELSDADLRAGIHELQALEDSGVLPDGTVRALARRIEAEAGLSAHDARSVVNSNLYRIAAQKWAGIEG